MKKKRKFGRKLLGFLITLAMLVGLMPGYSLVAEAAAPILATGGNLFAADYELTVDVKLTNNITIPNGSVVSIDLNGHGLIGNGNGSVITINSGGSLTLTDSSATGDHYITLDSSGKGIAVSDTAPNSGVEGTDYVKVTGGYITGGYADIGDGIYNEGTLTMTGGTIVGNVSTNLAGGGIRNEGTINLSGNPVVTHNKNYNILNVRDGSAYIVGSMGENARIGITRYDGGGSESTGTFARAGNGYAVTDSDISRFFPDNENYELMLNNGKLDITYKKTNLSGAIVTVDTTQKKVSVKLNDQTLINNYDYAYTFLKKNDTNGEYTDLNSTTFPTTDGTYKVWITACDRGVYYTRYEGFKESEPFTIGVKVTKVPTARELTYTGDEQELVTAGTATGGTMQYALGTATEATQAYSTSIPTATDAGTYYVWYKVKGDGTHEDSNPERVVVTISDNGKTDNGKTDNGKTDNGKTDNPSSDDTKESVLNDYLNHLYESVLKRELDETGKKDWSQMFKDGKGSMADVVYSVVNSPEYAFKEVSDEDYIDSLYQAILNRTPGAGEKQDWIEFLKNGGSREQVLVGFVNSDEFSALCDSIGYPRGTLEIGTDGKARSSFKQEINNFVMRNYKYALERTGEAKGVEYWCDKLEKKTMTPEDVAKSFFLSEEFTNKKLSDEDFVERLYLTFLDRASEPEGKAYWLDKLKNGTSREDIIPGFAYSKEFKNIIESFGL